MDPEAVQAMLREDRVEWQALVALLEAHPHGPLHDPTVPTWAARDVYTHLARLTETTTELIELKLSGQPLPKFDDADEDTVNARIQQKYSHMSLDEARAWAQRSFDARIEAISSIPPDRWDAAMEMLARADGADHYRGHRSYISVL